MRRDPFLVEFFNVCKDYFAVQYLSNILVVPAFFYA